MSICWLLSSLEGGAKHRVKIVKIEGKYSTVRDKEQEAAKSGWNAAFHYHSTKEFIKN